MDRNLDWHHLKRYSWILLLMLGGVGLSLTAHAQTTPHNLANYACSPLNLARLDTSFDQHGHIVKAKVDLVTPKLSHH